MVDCIIIGSGVAGISAALTLKANGKTALIFGSKALSEKIEKAELIQNYPGLSNVTGKGFVAALKEQLKDAKIEIIEEKVSGVYAMKEKFAVATQQGGMYESKSVILACGVESVKQIEGEDAYLGRGVSACATCDGFLYKGKTIAVFCTSKRLEHEIGYLADIAKKVYLIPMYKGVEIVRDNVEIIRKMPTKIDGAKRVERVCFGQDAVEIDGMFVLRECTSPAILVGGLDMQDGHVKVNRDMSTNLKGCYAARADLISMQRQSAKGT